MRVRLAIAYDGAAFSGWATQPGRRTVQETLEDALRLAFRLAERPGLTVAGRTDAGVHARGQVAHVDVDQAAWEETGPRLVRRLAGLLPADVRVRAAVPAAPGFDARFSALSRRYAYRLCDDPSGPDPLRRHDTAAVRRPLDVQAMNLACAPLAGEHDFAAYCKRRDGATTVRRLLRYGWTRRGGVLVADVEADAFCHNMVRALVGAAVAVGEGRRPAGWPAEVLAGRTRDPGVTVMPPHGLCLEEVRYPADADLAARAATTRRVRTEQ